MFKCTIGIENYFDLIFKNNNHYKWLEVDATVSYASVFRLTRLPKRGM